MLTEHRSLLITRNITWQPVSPSPPLPAKMHDSLSQEKAGSKGDDRARQIEMGGA